MIAFIAELDPLFMSRHSRGAAGFLRRSRAARW